MDVALFSKRLKINCDRKLWCSSSAFSNISICFDYWHTKRIAFDNYNASHYAIYGSAFSRKMHNYQISSSQMFSPKSFEIKSMRHPFKMSVEKKLSLEIVFNDDYETDASAIHWIDIVIQFERCSFYGSIQSLKCISALKSTFSHRKSQSTEKIRSGIIQCFSKIFFYSEIVFRKIEIMFD